MDILIIITVMTMTPTVTTTTMMTRAMGLKGARTMGMRMPEARTKVAAMLCVATLQTALMQVSGSLGGMTIDGRTPPPSPPHNGFSSTQLASK